MAQIILRGCCKFCKFSNGLTAFKTSIRRYKTKLVCDHPNNVGDLKNIFVSNMTHENGFCEHFQWGNVKKYSLILKTFDNIQKEEEPKNIMEH